MTKIHRALALVLLLAAGAARAVDAPFYFIDIPGQGKPVLYSESKTAPKGDLPYARVDRAGTACCFRATARKAPDADKFTAEEDKPVFSHAVAFTGAAKPEWGLAYGFEGMQAVTKKGRDTYQVTLQAGDPVFVRTCYSGEGMWVRLFHKLAEQKPYASYYYSLGFDVEPTCR
jgi:hypothetical protein